MAIGTLAERHRFSEMLQHQQQQDQSRLMNAVRHNADTSHSDLLRYGGC
jgi:hypothetical protein